jgi:glucose-1-phosphate cytidylyltransferase
MSDVTFDMKSNTTKIHRNNAEPWKVTLVDTGLETMTGGRLKAVKDYLDNETFCFTYGDGVSDINIGDLIKFHRNQKTLATVTSIQPPGRFGGLKVKGSKAVCFSEKPDGDGGWVSGGFFVLEPKVIDFIEGDDTAWEDAPLETLASDGQLSVYKYKGFWSSMDTLRDRQRLESLWNGGNPPWKVWE